MSVFLFSILSVFAWSSQPIALSENGTPLVVQSGDPYNNGYTEQRFNEVLNHLLKIYKPIIQAQGGIFKIKRDWGDGAVNMWAERHGNDFWLEVPGGMARYHLITEEGFISSLCHELGHLLGGEPKSGMISYEGQSDYFAGQTCIALVLKDLAPVKTSDPDLEVENICQQDLLCERVLKGAKSLTSYYAELERAPAPQLSTPSTQVVDKTLTSHPPAQCRLDTFFAGYQNRPRPACWYR